MPGICMQRYSAGNVARLERFIKSRVPLPYSVRQDRVTGMLAGSGFF